LNSVEPKEYTQVTACTFQFPSSFWDFGKDKGVFFSRVFSDKFDYDENKTIICIYEQFTDSSNDFDKYREARISKAYEMEVLKQSEKDAIVHIEQTKEGKFLLLNVVNEEKNENEKPKLVISVIGEIPTENVEKLVGMKIPTERKLEEGLEEKVKHLESLEGLFRRLDYESASERWYEEYLYETEGKNDTYESDWREKKIWEEYFKEKDSIEKHKEPEPEL
jgi:hypothetical protein